MKSIMPPAQRLNTSTLSPDPIVKSQDVMKYVRPERLAFQTNPTRALVVESVNESHYPHVSRTHLP
jgi:hypothetical protein